MDVKQHHVVNHFTGDETLEVRNVLVESARIVRGNVKSLAECCVNEFSALVVPGGFGVAKNLSNFVFKGTDVDINAEFLHVFREFKDQKKPVACMCIAPVLLPKVYGRGVTLTIGNDENTASTIKKMGGEHVNAAVGEVVFDEINNVLTTPAYMLAKNIVEAKSGIHALISRLVSLLQ